MLFDGPGTALSKLRASALLPEAPLNFLILEDLSFLTSTVNLADTASRFCGPVGWGDKPYNVEQEECPEGLGPPALPIQSPAHTPPPPGPALAPPSLLLTPYLLLSWEV